MNKSESIKNIAAAMNKAQAEMSGAKKTAKNPFFKSTYANLEEVINCLKEPFAANGLSYMQFPLTQDGYAGVTTLIMHESGEWLEQDLLLKCAKSDPQGMGSAITYARRYGLQAAAGLPSEDDDGNGASTPPKKTVPTTAENIAKCKTAIANAKDQTKLNAIMAQAVKLNIQSEVEAEVKAKEAELGGK